MDKAGKDYWDQTWTNKELGSPVNPHLQGIRNYAKRCFHAYFCKIFRELKTRK